MDTAKDDFRQVRLQGGKLSNDDLIRLGGGHEELAEILRFCNDNTVIASHAQAETQIHHELHNYKGVTNISTTRDSLVGKWPELKGQVQQQWGKLTDDDMTQLSGKTEELADILQHRYGYNQAKAESQIHNWLITMMIV